MGKAVRISSTTTHSLASTAGRQKTTPTYADSYRISASFTNSDLQNFADDYEDKRELAYKYMRSLK
ncbi:hypothetical protein PCCS19_18640 [Paenibacillus sp. CCS19]|nr:hypothetical protein PCCS19_18640 [Paenibacillus cellulosilyticus]